MWLPGPPEVELKRAFRQALSAVGEHCAVIWIGPLKLVYFIFLLISIQLFSSSAATVAAFLELSRLACACWLIIPSMETLNVVSICQCQWVFAQAKPSSSAQKVSRSLCVHRKKCFSGLLWSATTRIWLRQDAVGGAAAAAARPIPFPSYHPPRLC